MKQEFTMSTRLVILFLLALPGCEDTDAINARIDREIYEGPCHDESSLLATTGGSPSHCKCPNKLHRMHVQVATHPSNEEAAALVFCQCERPGQVDRNDAGSKAIK